MEMSNLLLVMLIWLLPLLLFQAMLSLRSRLLSDFSRPTQFSPPTPVKNHRIFSSCSADSCKQMNGGAACDKCLLRRPREYSSFFPIKPRTAIRTQHQASNDADKNWAPSLLSRRPPVITHLSAPHQAEGGGMHFSPSSSTTMASFGVQKIVRCCGQK